MGELSKQDLSALARGYDCLEAVDASVFQREARILQVDVAGEVWGINGLGSDI